MSKRKTKHIIMARDSDGDTIYINNDTNQYTWDFGDKNKKCTLERILNGEGVNIRKQNDPRKLIGKYTRIFI